MNISNNGKNFIKKYEGCILHAYKPVSSEKFFTIGYGHYGQDVKAGQTITQQQASDLFDKDIIKYVQEVNQVRSMYPQYLSNLSQNQFDALVSFDYNCGMGSLISVCKYGKDQIKNRMSAYVHDSNGKVLDGLVRRRKDECSLFDSNKIVKNSSFNGHLHDLQGAINQDYKTKLIPDGIWGPKTNNAINSVCLKKGDSHYNVIAWVQIRIGTNPDGIFGDDTRLKVKRFQEHNGLSVDGIAGPQTIKAILRKYGVVIK